MDCEPYIGELVAAKGVDNGKCVLGMIVQINDWEHEEIYRIQWFDDYSLCDYNENDYYVFRDRMLKVRKEYGL